MNTNVEALKALYEALGGDPSEVTEESTIPGMIMQIAGIAGSTVELPKVKNADNGDVLTVVSGKWAKAEIPLELPQVSASNVGMVLQVNAEGKWVAASL